MSLVLVEEIAFFHEHGSITERIRILRGVLVFGLSGLVRSKLLMY